MTWEDIITHGVEDRELTEWRGRISKGQKKQNSLCADLLNSDKNPERSVASKAP
jgi:hypothetical protein